MVGLLDGVELVRIGVGGCNCLKTGVGFVNICRTIGGGWV
jgi:hypothetical protein